MKLDHAPRQAALALLPLLLSNPPFIPASVTSVSLNRRHQILESSPEDVEEYLVTDTYPTKYPTATRSVELLQTLNSLVEDQGPSVIGRIQFKCPEKDEILVGVELGDMRSSEPPLLLLLLKLEGDKKDSDSYKYDNLLPINVVPGPWLNSLEEAISFFQTTTDLTGSLLRAFPEDIIGSRDGSGTTLDVLQSRHDRHREDESLPAEEEAQGGGEYIVDAHEFWEGFGSDEDEPGSQTVQKDSQASQEESEEDIQRRLQIEEERYWEMYDQTGTAALEQTRPDVTRSNGKMLDKIDLDTNDHQRTVHDRERLNQMTSLNEPIKLMMKDAWRLMQDAHVGLANENDFLQLAREAIQEVQLETNSFDNE